jgi:hypothetical protein
VREKSLLGPLWQKNIRIEACHLSPTCKKRCGGRCGDGDWSVAFIDALALDHYYERFRGAILRSPMNYWFLVLLLAGFSYAAAGPSTLIANISGRSTVNLDGAWRAIVDPYDNGSGAKFYRDEKPRDKGDRVEYSFDASPVLNVPGDWNTQREQLLFYEGPVWYRRGFSYHKRANTRVFVYFGAANYLAAVYLNGEKLGDHEGVSRRSISRRPRCCARATISLWWR